MKRVILSASDEYIPHMSEDEYAYLELLNDALYEKIGKKYRRLKVRFDNVSVDDDGMYAEIELSDKGDPFYNATFKFAPYDSYYDEVEFQSHLMRKIKTFVDNLYHKV